MAVAGTDGRHDNSLEAILHTEAYRFDLRQAVRLLELMSPSGCVPVGAGSDPRREALQLRSSLSSSFPPSDVESLGRKCQARPASIWEEWYCAYPHDSQSVLTVSILGLAGAFGPLPPPLTARVLEQERDKDHSAREFLDIFNHRLLSLLLRLDQLFAPALQIDSLQSLASVERSASLPLLALLGLATLSAHELDDRLDGLVPSLIGSAGLLNSRPTSAHALERLLNTHFGWPVRVLPLRGGWLDLALDQCTRLGRTGLLGKTSLLGSRVWDEAASICIEIGPIDRATMMKFLPDGAWYRELAQLAAFVMGDAFDIQLHLLLRADQVPPGSLDEPRPRLGWTSWIGQASWQNPALVQLRLNIDQPAPF